MKKFKIGQKVTFIQDGKIGNMNKVLYDHNRFDIIYEVIAQCDGITRISSNGLDFDVPETCIEPVPEPPPKFANIKVGDWVEWIYDGNVTQSEFMGFDMCHLYRIRELGSTTSHCVSECLITRILSPKEVIVDFGSGIKGTVRRSGLSGLCVVTSKNGELVAWVKLSLLDPQVRAIVESLLKAQEEVK